MPTQERDIQFVQAGLEILPDYLLSKELFWPLSAPKIGYTLPRFTVGGMLVALHRIRAYASSSLDRAELLNLEHRIDTLRHSRRVAWENKVSHEIRARFNLWQNYISDLKHNRENHADAYAHEVNWRVMLDLLMDELPTDPPEKPAIEALDMRIRSHWHPGDFIWDAELQSAFPKEPFWYLYGNLIV